MANSDRTARGLVRKIAKRLMTGDGVPLWLAIGIVFVVADLLTTQARTLGLPIMGEHRWREADTYAVAYNFAHESLDFFHPRSDLTRGRTGITGMEPPIYPYVTALAMKVFGDAPTVGRAIVWLTEVMGLTALLALMRRIRDTGLAMGFLLAFALSPLALFELRQVQPDGPTGMFAAIAAFFLYRFSEEEKRRDYWLGVGAFALSVLLKGPMLFMAPAFAWFACAARPVTRKQFLLRCLGVGLAVAVYLPWYRWAHHLTATYNAGIANFRIDFTWKGVKEGLNDRDHLHNVFWFLFPTYVGNWVLFPALLVGVPAAFGRGARRASFGFLLWLLCGLLFLGCFSWLLEAHWYYANIILVPTAYFTGFGLAEVLRFFAAQRVRLTMVARWSVLVILSTMVIQRLIAPLGHKVGEGVAAFGAHPEGSWMTENHLTALLCLLSFAMVVAECVSLRWVRIVAVALLPFAAYFGIGRARRNALEVLRARTHASEKNEFVSRWMNTLRPLVDRYSTRADLFVVNIPEGTIAQDAFYLNLPLRKGWSEDADGIKKNGLSSYRDAGARFYLTYNATAIPDEDKLAKIGEETYFRLYCIDPKGCPAIR
jgi:hypothetical protein